jgi:hypothetical protein
MVRDAVANIVIRLQECGFDPRRIAADAWESRCPAHRSADCALSITRDAHNHVVLECRSAVNCQHYRIIGALGLTNDHVYEETPDWLISRLSRAPVQSASFASSDVNASYGVGVTEGDTGSGSAGAPPLDDGCASADDLSATNPVTPSPLPDPLPVGARAMSGAHCAGDREDTVSAACASSIVSGDASSESDTLVGQMIGDAQEFGRSVVESTGGQSEKSDRQTSVRALTRLASSAQLFRSADGNYCAQVQVGDRLEIFGLRSAGFRDWLIDGYMNGQTEPPSSWAIRRVVGMLEARARFTTGMPQVYVRVGQETDGGETAYFVDLGDSSGAAVAIRDQGWSVVDRPGVHFRRPGGLLPLPSPARDGSIDLLRRYVNLTEADFRLMIAWLTAALRPVGPYPVLVLNGEQSSGKSTLARILRLLIDPHTSPVLALPSSAENLMATAFNGWLLAYENISTIPGWLSDCVCQLAFGGGFASRALFTNDERSDIFAQRPVILVGIDDFVLRGDLRDRSVFLHLPAIPELDRRTERSFWPAFRLDYPRILGGALDAIVGGLRELPLVDLKGLPRMADFAEWGEATSRGLGWGAGAFISTYKDNRKEAAEVMLDDSPLAMFMLALARYRFEWSRTPKDLYLEIMKLAGRSVVPGWPTTISKFGTELRRIAPQLRLHGLSINFERRGGNRIVNITSEGAAAGPPSPNAPKP